jgi:hypothetical protein
MILVLLKLCRTSTYSFKMTVLTACVFRLRIQWHPKDKLNTLKGQSHEIFWWTFFILSYSLYSNSYSLTKQLRTFIVRKPMLSEYTEPEPHVTSWSLKEAHHFGGAGAETALFWMGPPPIAPALTAPALTPMIHMESFWKMMILQNFTIHTFHTVDCKRLFKGRSCSHQSQEPPELGSLNWSHHSQSHIKIVTLLRMCVHL